MHDHVGIIVIFHLSSMTLTVQFKHYAETKLVLIFYFFISITGQRSQLFITTYFATL